MSGKEVFAANLCRLLEEKDEKQTDLARFLHVSNPTVSDWCKGKKMPKIDKIGAMVRHFGCKYTDLLGEGMDDEEEDTVFLFFRSLSDEGKKRVLSYAAYLLSEEARDRHAEDKS